MDLSPLRSVRLLSRPAPSTATRPAPPRGGPFPLRLICRPRRLTKIARNGPPAAGSRSGSYDGRQKRPVSPGAPLFRDCGAVRLQIEAPGARARRPRRACRGGPVPACLGAWAPACAWARRAPAAPATPARGVATSTCRLGRAHTRALKGVGKSDRTIRPVFRKSYPWSWSALGPKAGAQLQRVGYYGYFTNLTNDLREVEKSEYQGAVSR